MLRQNWHEGEADGVTFAYTEPSPGRYPWQWYWDSCFAAIVNRRFEAERSRAELESLLAAQRPDGFIGHTIFWHTPVSGVRRPFYNVATRTARQTETIQPPLLAWAWRLAVGDPALEPRIGAQADWLARHRDLEGDGLLWIVQPDESGLDASPKFDPVWGRRANGRAGFPLLVARNRRLGWDARRIRDRGGPVLCETLVNTLWSLSLQSLGRPSATPALVDRLWDERRGLFVDEAQPGAPPPRSRDLGEPGAAGAARPARGDRPTAGRGAPAERARVPDPGGAPLGLGRRARPTTRPAAAARSAVTGAARPGSTRAGSSGSACAASATSPRPSTSPPARPEPSPTPACASTTTRATAPAKAPKSSPGQP